MCYSNETMKFSKIHIVTLYKVTRNIFAFIGLFLTVGYIGIISGLTRTAGIVDNQRGNFDSVTTSTHATSSNTNGRETWKNTDEWRTLQQAIINDRESIYKAAALLDINPRTIVAIISVEQLRLYTDNREVYKKFFGPLLVLGVQNQYSWGVAGIKEDTAITSENYLIASTSPFYLGKQYEQLLQFSSNNNKEERFARITNKDDRFYSYLYTAVIIKQLENQWRKQGFPIAENTGVLATLYNIGFAHSKPHAHPQSGGAAININGTTYSFGGLASEVYRSNELTTYFPK